MNNLSVNNEHHKILVNNINILYNIDKDYNDKCMIIYDYLKRFNITYDDEFLLKKIKECNPKLYKVYLRIINTIYENLNTNNLDSEFDDYEGYNIWNRDGILYNEIYALLSRYND